MLQLQKCKDLFDFGCSVFDIMTGKYDLNNTTKLMRDSVVVHAKEEIMPLVEGLPRGWAKMPELASLLQILHLCWVIDAR